MHRLVIADTDGNIPEKFLPNEYSNYIVPANIGMRELFKEELKEFDAL